MIVLPVIARELRVSARHAFTYYLRALGVAALVLACLLFGAQQGFGPALGSKLFGSLHFTLFCAIWVLVPLLTADCISRERREGTLGLLFLTRLNAQDIVAAKTAAQALRALTLWLAVLPVLAIPFLMGGVSSVKSVSHRRRYGGNIFSCQHLFDVAGCRTLFLVALPQFHCGFSMDAGGWTSGAVDGRGSLSLDRVALRCE